MKQFFEWKKNYANLVPEFWDEWLMMVHACLQVMEGNGDFGEVQKQYKIILSEKSKPLEIEAKNLGIIFVPCTSIEDIITLRLHVQKRKLLLQEWKSIESEALSWGIPLPTLVVEDKTQENLDQTKEFLQIEQQKKKEHPLLMQDWFVIMEKRKSLLLSLPQYPSKLDTTTLEQLYTNHRKDLSLLREIEVLMKKAHALGIYPKARAIAFPTIIYRNFICNQIEERRSVWERLDQIEVAYKNIRITRIFSQAERISIYKEGLEKIEDHLLEAEQKESLHINYAKYEEEKLSIHPYYWDSLPTFSGEIIKKEEDWGLLYKYRSKILNHILMWFAWLHPEWRYLRTHLQDIRQKCNQRYVRYGSIQFVFTHIPSGQFTMGISQNKDIEDETRVPAHAPAHRVHISNEFEIGISPVTQELYEYITEKNPSHIKGKTHPVTNVSWCDAIVFCNKLSQKEGLDCAYDIPEPFSHDAEQSTNIVWNKKSNGYRLPTEAEWEYCARPRSFSLFGRSGPHEIGYKKSNYFGVYDMTSNIYEWCWDTWDKNAYKRTAVVDPVVEKRSERRVYRGHNTHRNEAKATSCLNNLGFRIIRGVTLP